MNEKQKRTISKFLSLVLRHSPETIELKLDGNGWAEVEELLSKSAKYNRHFSIEELKEIVITNDKQRFALNESATKIRANRGHSIEIELNLVSQSPPEFLFHGTVDKFLQGIKVEGLQKMNRQHVHLSKDKDTAEKVGSRRGEAVILRVHSGAMHIEGFIFYLSENGVWLTDHVPFKYIEINS
jgi:putative RNA 2'-phosphotransferase